jgi:hypothetical protein
MRNYGQYQSRGRQTGRTFTNARQFFDVARLNAQLERVKAMGLTRVLGPDTIYITDKALATGVAWEKWFVVYLKGQYKFILSSPQVWSKILNV